MSDERDDRQRRKARYESVLACVEKNTGRPGRPQRAGIEPARVVMHLAAHGRYDHDAVRRSIQAARSNDDLLKWTDGEGTARLSRTTVEGLQAVVAEQNQRETPDVELCTRVSNLKEAIHG